MLFGKKGEPISAQDMRKVLKEKLGIDMLPENTHDLSEVFGNEDDKEGRCLKNWMQFFRHPLFCENK